MFSNHKNLIIGTRFDKTIVTWEDKSADPTMFASTIAIDGLGKCSGLFIVVDPHETLYKNKIFIWHQQ